jgi:hypothetical protein
VGMDVEVGDESHGGIIASFKGLRNRILVPTESTTYCTERTFLPLRRQEREEKLSLHDE